MGHKPRSTILLLVSLAFFGGAAIAYVETLQLDPALWGAYSFLILVGEGLLYLAWRMVEGDGAERKLFSLALIGLILRIAVGVALYQGLPRWGYNEKAQRAGYVYWDAYKRDTDAYALARSEQPILNAFSSDAISDQYGGLLALSAFIYRYSPVEGHHPILVVLPLAAISSLAILFTWGFARQAFTDRIALVSAFLVTLYPEAILLGASQMREPFLMAGFALALLGYSYIRSDQHRIGIIVLVLSLLLLGLPISPPFIAVVLGTIMLLWLWQARGISRGQVIGLAMVLLIAIMAMVYAARSWADLQGLGGSTLDVFRGWLENATSDWRFNLVSDQSALVDSLLDRLPAGLKLPFLVLYGVIQPFLPAAIMAPGAPIWKIVGIWRSLGWFLLLPLLTYATIRAARVTGWRSSLTFFVLFVWVTALMSSYRAPSYQWDSPRYRAVFISVQAIIAAWAWSTSKIGRDVWLARLFVVFCIIFSVFTLWYGGRYLGGLELSINTTLVLAVAASMLYLSIVALIDRRGSVGLPRSG